MIIFIEVIVIIQMDNNQCFHSQLLSIFNKLKENVCIFLSYKFLEM